MKLWGDSDLIMAIAEDCVVFGTFALEDVRQERKKEGLFDRFKNWVQSAPAVVKRKIKVFIMQEDQKEQFIKYLLVLRMSNPQMEINFNERLVDRRRKIPQTKIMLKYFAGKPEKDLVYLGYDFNTEE